MCVVVVEIEVGTGVVSGTLMIYCDPDSGSCFLVSFDDDPAMTIDNKDFASPALTPETVPLRSGPPTREELLVHYPAKFTWAQLKTFVNSG